MEAGVCDHCVPWIRCDGHCGAPMIRLCGDPGAPRIPCDGNHSAPMIRLCGDYSVLWSRPDGRHGGCHGYYGALETCSDDCHDRYGAPGACGDSWHGIPWSQLGGRCFHDGCCWIP